MISVSNEFLTKIKQSSRTIDCKVEINGHTLNASLISNFIIESSFGNNDIPTIGSVVSNKLTIKLINSDTLPQILIGVPIIPYVAIDIGGGTYEWIKMGKFFANNDGITKTKLNTAIEAFDKLYSLDIDYVTSLTLPLTVNSVKADLTRYGLTFAIQPSLPNVSLSSIPKGTVRQVISQLASLLTTSATIDENGDVAFKFLANCGFTLDTSNYSDFKLTPDKSVKISQLQIKDGENVIAVGDSTGYALQLANPLIETQSDLQTIYNRAFPVNYYGYYLKLQGMPHLQIGDVVQLTYLKMDGVTSTINIPILNHKFSFSGGMTSVFNSNVPKETQTTVTPSSGSIISDVVKQVSKNLEAAVSEATGIITGNQGGNVIIVLDNDSKPKELVICDTGDINNAQKIWRWNNSGLGFSLNGYLGPYEIAMTQDGKFVADFITAGTLTGININSTNITGGTINGANLKSTGLMGNTVINDGGITVDGSTYITKISAQGVNVYDPVRGYTVDINARYVSSNIIQAPAGILSVTKDYWAGPLADVETNAVRLPNGAKLSQATLQLRGGTTGTSASCWTGFYDNVGTRYGYVGKGSGGNNDIYLYADIGSLSINSQGYLYANAPNGIYLNGATILKQQSEGSLRVSSVYGYIDIAPKNSSYCHFYTDRPSFYFNKGAYFVGQSYFEGVYDAGSGRGFAQCINIAYIRMVEGGSPYLEVTTGGSQWGLSAWGSDARLKENIIDSSINALSKVSQIKHREFDFKTGEHSAIGYVAQELMSIDEDFVFPVSQQDGTELYFPKVSTLVPYLSRAIQQLKDIVDSQGTEIEKLKFQLGGVA